MNRGRRKPNEGLPLTRLPVEAAACPRLVCPRLVCPRLGTHPGLVGDMSGIDKALYERLYQQALAEWYAPDFYGVWIMNTTWGRKPRA